MGQTPKESEQIVADSPCQKTQNIQPGTEKSMLRPENCGMHQEANILSLTPSKTNEPLHVKCKKEGAQLPEKYKTLSELFNRMTTSLRLLSVGKKAPTFCNVSRQVKVLTGREFSHRHLAQIKFIIPEAVQIDKILIHDEKTSCMEPEMKINLLFDAIEGHNQQSSYTAMQQLFSSKLFNYIGIHPEGCEIPEAELPEPFNKQSINIATDLLAKDSFLPEIIDAELLKSSHICPSFNRHFSTKAFDVETKESKLLPSEVPLSSTRTIYMINQEPSDLSVLEKPFEVACPQHESTPMKLALESDNLIIETPAQATPKRSVSSDNKPKTAMSQKLMASSMSVKRSLHFQYLEGDELFLDSNIDNMELTEGVTKVVESSPVPSKNAVSNEDELMPHKQKPARLYDLVSIIHHIFQSARCSAITKQELVHKILMNNLDAIESGEVEEQLVLLEKLVPEWISKNVAPTGDILYRIKNVGDLNFISENLI